MDETILTAEELERVHHNRNQSFNIPSFGEKKSEPTQDDQTPLSNEEKREIERRLDIMKDCLSVPRVAQRSQVSEGEWKDNLVYVYKKIGKHWDVFGHTVNQQLFLYPEEALFLLESNSIEIKCNGIPMSLHQAYTLMLGNNNCSLDEFRTFSHLTKQGFKVIRHQGNLGITKYGKKINLDKHLLKSSKQKRGLDDDIDIEEIIVESSKKQCLDEDIAVEIDVVNNSDNGAITIHEEIIIDSGPASPEIQIIDELSDDEVKIVDTKQDALDMLPNFFGKQKMTIKTPNTELLPFRAWPSKKEYNLYIEIRQNEESTSNVVIMQQPKPDQNNISNISSDHDLISQDLYENCEVLNPLHPVQDRPKGKATAGQTVKNTSLVVLRQNRGYYPQAEHRDLREYLNSKKRNSKWNLPERKQPEIVTIEDDDLSVLKEGPLRSLWLSKTCPMIKPSDGSSTLNILTKLQFSNTTIHQDKVKDTTTTKSIHFQGQKFKISYDIYAPGVHFKKSNPCLPNFRIVIMDSNDKVPTKTDMQTTLGSITDGVPLLFSIVSHGDIAFYSLYPVDLPLQITMG